MGPCLPLTRVIALIGAVELISAFLMPWFVSQGLLLSGQFLNDFLSSASPADLQRLVPGTSPTQAQLPRLLVNLFPACGLLGAVLSILLAVVPHVALKLLLALSGIVPLVAWAIGVTSLPPGSTPQIGLWLIASGSLAVLLGALLEFAATRPRIEAADTACDVSPRRSPATR